MNYDGTMYTKHATFSLTLSYDLRRQANPIKYVLMIFNSLSIKIQTALSPNQKFCAHQQSHRLHIKVSVDIKRSYV